MGARDIDQAVARGRRSLAMLLTASLALVTALAGSASAQSADSRLAKIKESATIRIAYRTDSRPFSFVDPQGRPTGYTIELCVRIAESIKKQLGLGALDVQWVPVDTQNRFEAIASGAADLECGSTTVSLARMQRVDFSSFVYAESTGVLVKANAGLFAFNDLAGRKIAVIPGSTNAQAVRDQLQRRRIEAKLIDFSDRNDAMAALGRGEVDGFASDKIVLVALAQAAGLRNVTMLAEDLSFEPFAIMLPRGDWQLRLAVNSELARTFRSGEILALHAKYFGAFDIRSNWLGAIFTFGGLSD
jgi:ABC-type amino acid transport substrate-binding protein